MKELSITPREYQLTILKTCIEKDCLVILPTGTGKTLIAIMLAVEQFEKFPLEKILILAPTRPLVEQHFNSFKKNLPWDCNMQIFTGKIQAEKRKKIWQEAEFIFSTPQCISNDLKKNLYSLDDVSLLVFDECHRCLKNYAYNFISQKYKSQALHKKILGLTASPGANREKIKKVCENLGVQEVEARTRDSPDVRPYLQELEFEKIEVNFPAEFEEIRCLLREIYDKKIQELKNRKILFINPTKTILLEIQKKLFKAINLNKEPNLMRAVSICAQAIKIQHALELLETQTLESFILYIRALFEQAGQKKSKAVLQIVQDARFLKAYTLASTINFEHPKLIRLEEIIKEQFLKNPESKILVFSQFRDTVKKITDTLNKIPGIKSRIFVGQAKKISQGNETGLNQAEQKEIIQDFSSGKINILVATSIAEEGLDIPEVSEVIFYEPVPSAIRSIQRRGRTARMSPGSLKILITKNTRDESYHYASRAREKQINKAINEIKEGFKNKKQEKLF